VGEAGRSPPAFFREVDMLMSGAVTGGAMASLAQLSELVGFFSYAREDDSILT
jgi:hypothetical protein